MKLPELPAVGGPLIYVVDDTPCLTRLYALLLEGTGCLVKTFIDRAEALAALKSDQKKPDLLITDYRGRSMPAERFMHQCLAVHPALRILMASGWSESDDRFSQVRPCRFIRKPFTPDEFRQAIRAALAPADFPNAPQTDGRHSPHVADTAIQFRFSKKPESS